MKRPWSSSSTGAVARLLSSTQFVHQWTDSLLAFEKEWSYSAALRLQFDSSDFEHKRALVCRGDISDVRKKRSGRAQT